jgi:hypothetical protein
MSSHQVSLADDDTHETWADLVLSAGRFRRVASGGVDTRVSLDGKLIGRHAQGTLASWVLVTVPCVFGWRRFSRRFGWGAHLNAGGIAEATGCRPTVIVLSADQRRYHGGSSNRIRTRISFVQQLNILPPGRSLLLPRHSHGLDLQLVHGCHPLVDRRQLCRSEVDIAVGHLQPRVPQAVLQADGIAPIH